MSRRRSFVAFRHFIRANSRESNHPDHLYCKHSSSNRIVAFSAVPIARCIESQVVVTSGDSLVNIQIQELDPIMSVPGAVINTMFVGCKAYRNATRRREAGEGDGKMLTLLTCRDMKCIDHAHIVDSGGEMSGQQFSTIHPAHTYQSLFPVARSMPVVESPIAM